MCPTLSNAAYDTCHDPSVAYVATMPVAQPPQALMAAPRPARIPVSVVMCKRRRQFTVPGKLLSYRKKNRNEERLILSAEGGRPWEDPSITVALAVSKKNRRFCDVRDCVRASLHSSRTGDCKSSVEHKKKTLHIKCFESDVITIRYWVAPMPVDEFYTYTVHVMLEK